MAAILSGDYAAVSSTLGAVVNATEDERRQATAGISEGTRLSTEPPTHIGKGLAGRICEAPRPLVIYKGRRDSLLVRTIPGTGTQPGAAATKVPSPGFGADRRSAQAPVTLAPPQQGR